MKSAKHARHASTCWVQTQLLPKRENPSSHRSRFFTCRPYTSSASKGCPACAMCTLIWCVRPVTGRQHTRQHPTPFTRAAGSAPAAGPHRLDDSCWGHLLLTDSTCSMACVDSNGLRHAADPRLGFACGWYHKSVCPRLPRVQARQCPMPSAIKMPSCTHSVTGFPDPWFCLTLHLPAHVLQQAGRLRQPS